MTDKIDVPTTPSDAEKAAKETEAKKSQEKFLQRLERALKDSEKNHISEKMTKALRKMVRHEIEFNSEEMISYIAKQGIIWRAVYAFRILFAKPRNGKFFNKIEY